MWHKITKVDTGETQIVESLEGYNTDDWQVESIDKPKEHEVLDPESKKFVDHRKTCVKFPTTEAELREFILKVMEENKES